MTQYGELLEPVPLGHNWELEVVIQPAAGASFPHTIFAGSNNGTGIWSYVSENTGRAVVRVDGTVFRNPSPVITDGNPHTAIYKCVEGVLTLTVDGETSPTTTFTSELDIALVGYRGNYGYFGGPIYDMKLWVDGDRNTGTLVRHWPIDDGPCAGS
jgi:hypothetical protein